MRTLRNKSKSYTKGNRRFQVTLLRTGCAGGQPVPAAGREIHIVHHRFDDSIFVDRTYIVEGVAGTLLRRRLAEKRAPLQIVRIGRGRVRLEAEGPIILDAARE